MDGKELIGMGYQEGPVVGIALSAYETAVADGMRPKDARLFLEAVRAKPRDFVHNDKFGVIAKKILERTLEAEEITALAEARKAKPMRIWGESGIDPNAIAQINIAMELPISVHGALLPDGHLGYGLPIGGVLACDNAVIPNGVGVDIACRMKMSILDVPVEMLRGGQDKLIKGIEKETRFGVGCDFTRSGRRNHEVMDSDDWNAFPLLAGLKDKAWVQLGSSGGGNHFVEYGLLTLPVDFDGVPAGQYVALLSHSGSRGAGSKIADHFHRKAIAALPRKYEGYKNLAWFTLDTEDGQAYWLAMNLMGRYASANHEMIHKHVAKSIGAQILGGVENHHNFAWKEQHGGKEVIVHRKGATPAGEGVLGVIPGSMADACYVVRGKGSDASLKSASHGAGRLMSRGAAKQKFTWSEWRKELENRGVTLVSAGLDEVPGCYKNIDDVMAAQTDLVETVARFDPKIVKMADDGTAED